MIATLMSHEHLWEVVETTWSTLLSLEVTRDDSECVAHGSAQLTGSVHIDGAYHGAVLFLPTEQFARRAAARMLDVPESALAVADVEDAVAELSNILGGGVKNLVPGPSALSLPNVLWGPQRSLRSPPARVAAALHFACEGQPLEVRVLEECGEPPPVPSP